MSSAWSVFAVPASELANMGRALAGLELQDGKLFVGWTLAPVRGGEPWVAFGIEHQGWRYVEPVSDDDLPPSFFGAFTRLVSVYGASNTDSVLVTQYVRGTPRIQRDTCYGASLLPLVNVLGFDVVSLGSWGGFGINPPELSGDCHPLDAVPPLDGSARTCAPLPDPLAITESLEELEAAAGGSPEARARWALALVYREVDVYEGMDVLTSLRRELSPDSPVGRAVHALLDQVGW
ncbi:MAG: hypothetical protein H6734_10160 [Alphaproteobacteria bacterium]|nr:hypothetical protein [Alphaproteobacteria bacterium]